MVNKDPLRYSLPPVPPPGAFDVRFSGDLKYSENGGEILIRNDHYPLTIHYEGAGLIEEEAEWVLVNTGSGEELVMCGGEVVINSSVSVLLLTKRTISPNDFILHQNFPNPFNPIAKIVYGLPEYANVQIIIYDLTGRRVQSLINESQIPGYHSINWNAGSHPSGMYFITMRAGEYVNTQKLMLVK